MTTTLPAGITAEAQAMPDGGVNYVLTGPAGAVTIPRASEAERAKLDGLSLNSTAVQAGFGPVGIHRRHEPVESSRGPGECDALEEGRCWPDVTYLGADYAADSFNAGGEDALWSYLYGWYRSHLAPYEED